VIAFAKGLTPNLKMIITASKLLPGKARNQALKEVCGPWIYFLDDDAVVPDNYWPLLYELLQDERVEVLGGPDAPAPEMSPVSTGLALALSSPFCSGTTFARHESYGKGLQLANEEKLTSCNLWVKTTALEGVLFPEDFVRAEENVFLFRLKNLGRHMYYHPRLKVYHHRRSRPIEMIRPAFYAGFYRSRLMDLKMGRPNNLFWLPSIFVILHLFIFIDSQTFWYLTRMYVSIILFVSISISMKAKRPGLFAFIAFFHYFLVLLFGLGFLFERVSFKKKDSRN
jgi:GT2 family glycosyltransferase